LLDEHQAHEESDLVVSTTRGKMQKINLTDPRPGGYNVPLAANPFNSWAKVIDCGDIPVCVFPSENLLSTKRRNTLYDTAVLSYGLLEERYFLSIVRFNDLMLTQRQVTS
jgi:hypothetical protein